VAWRTRVEHTLAQNSAENGRQRISSIAMEFARAESSREFCEETIGLAASILDISPMAKQKDPATIG
jgi:hypothetical protein